MIDKDNIAIEMILSIYKYSLNNLAKVLKNIVFILQTLAMHLHYKIKSFYKTQTQ